MITLQASMPTGWNITYLPKPIGTSEHDYDFWHENYDGENDLCGTASSLEDAIQQINEMGFA